MLQVTKIQSFFELEKSNLLTYTIEKGDKKWLWVFLAPGLKEWPQDSFLGSFISLSSSLHIVARWLLATQADCLSSTPAEKRMPIYLLLWQKFRISFDYTDLCPMLFPDLITVPRGVENTAWLGLDLEWDWPHPNDLG